MLPAALPGAHRESRAQRFVSGVGRSRANKVCSTRRGPLGEYSASAGSRIPRVMILVKRKTRSAHPIQTQNRVRTAHPRDERLIDHHHRPRDPGVIRIGAPVRRGMTDVGRSTSPWCREGFRNIPSLRRGH